MKKVLLTRWIKDNVPFEYLGIFLRILTQGKNSESGTYGTYYDESHLREVLSATRNEAQYKKIKLR